MNTTATLPLSLDCSAEILAGSVDGSVRRFDVRMGRLFTDDLHHPVTCVKGALPPAQTLHQSAVVTWTGWCRGGEGQDAGCPPHSPACEQLVARRAC